MSDLLSTLNNRRICAYTHDIHEVNLAEELDPTEFTDRATGLIDVAKLDRAVGELGEVTYGGFGEERRNLWTHCEPDSPKRMTHLGIDTNFAVHGMKYVAGRVTDQIRHPVIAPVDGKVVHVMRDESKQNGWGGRIVIEMDKEHKGARYLLFGHLSPDFLTTATRVSRGDCIGFVAEISENGGWHYHIHNQLVKQRHLDDVGGRWEDVDGYILDKDGDVSVDDWAADPTELICCDEPFDQPPTNKE